MLEQSSRTFEIRELAVRVGATRSMTSRIGSRTESRWLRPHRQNRRRAERVLVTRNSLAWLSAVGLLMLAQSARAQQLGALYRDGELVDSVGVAGGAAVASNDEATTTAAPAAASRGTGRFDAASARRGNVAASPPSPETLSRNRLFSRAADHAADVRASLRRMASEPGDRRKDRQAVRKAWRRFMRTQREARAVLDEIGERVDAFGLDQTIQQRHRDTVEAFEKGVAEASARIHAVIRDEDGAVERALEFMDGFRFREDPPLLSSGLPHQIHIEKARRIDLEALGGSVDGVAGAVAEGGNERSASPGGVPTLSPPPPTPSDLAATIDVQLTAEIAVKVADLGSSPVAIYEFVRNTVAFQPYLGSRKGSAATLTQLRGNDTDQASLLIALLRSAGIPSRYVRGTIEIDANQAKSWLGVDDAGTAADLLATAGMSPTAIVSGGQVVSIRFTHLWVEAFVPYSNYRGVPNDAHGKVWVPLDPSFKGSIIRPGTDPLATIGFNIDDYLGDYISSFHAPSPLEKLTQDVQAHLDTNSPGTTVADVERTTAIDPRPLGILPASPPYRILSITERVSEIEAAKRYQVRLHLYQGGTPFIDYTASLPELVGKRVTIQYVGATAADQATIDSFGGIYETPPNLVNVKPVLKLDNVVVATSTSGIGMGRTHTFDMHFVQPSGASNVQPLVRNDIIAGNGEAIGFDTFLDVDDALIDDDPFPAGAFLESHLHSTAVDYLSRVDRGLEQAGRLMGVVTTEDVSEAIVQNSISVAFSFGVPVSFEWTGLTVDADRRVIGPFAVNGDDAKARPYMILTGMDSSVMENRVFEDRFGQQAVSTIKILELASAGGVAICTIDSSIAADCPTMNQPASVVSAVNAALASGHVVTIPRTGITVVQWSGTGYIDMDPVSGAAGYIISGGINGGLQSASGGSTVDSWPVNLSCDATSVTGEALQPAADSPDPSAVFCADNTTITFVVRLTWTCRQSGAVETKDVTLVTHKTKKQFGGGNYDLQLIAFGTSTIRRITIVEAEVTEVGFSSDHQISKWPSGAKIDDPDGSAATWKKMGNPNDPVAYTKAAKATLFGRLEIKPTFSGSLPVELRILDGGSTIATRGGVNLTGSSVDVAGLSATVPLETTIKKSTPSFAWEMRCTGGGWESIGTSGPHTMYWTDATPILPPFQEFNPPGGATFSPLYDLALEKATAYVNGNATPVNRITAGIDSDIPYDPSIKLPAGHPLNAYFGGGYLCGDLAALLRGLLRSVGIDGTVLYIWGGTNNTTMLRYTIGSVGAAFPTFRVLRGAHDAADPNPHFSYHAVVSANGTLFDPSYGISYPALVFDETAFNATPQQTSTTFPLLAANAAFVCPH